MSDEPVEPVEPDTDPEPEPESEPEPEPESPEVNPTATTTRTKDYAGRALTNIATNGTDYLGRPILTGNVDFMGRALVA